MARANLASEHGSKFMKVAVEMDAETHANRENRGGDAADERLSTTTARAVPHQQWRTARCGAPAYELVGAPRADVCCVKKLRGSPRQLSTVNQHRFRPSGRLGASRYRARGETIKCPECPLRMSVVFAL